LAGAVRGDDDEDPGDDDSHIRRLNALERLEEYSAAHGEPFDVLGEWPAERFEDAWHAYQQRTALDRIEADRRDMTFALYSNGMIGGDDLTREIESINRASDDARRRVLRARRDDEPGKEEEEDEEHISRFDSPMVAKGLKAGA
jgi:hypothetical protein